MALIGNPLITTNYITDSFSGDNSTVAFTLSQAPASAQSIAVFISGLYQIPTSAYSISGTTLTFTAAPPTGTSNILVLHLGVQNQNLVPSAASITPAMLNNANVIYWSTSNNNIGIGNVTPTSLLTVTGTAALGNTTITGFANVTGTAALGNTTITGTLTASANVNLDSGTLVVDGTNNRVGVNQSSPTTTFHVNAGRTTLVANGESYALGVGYTAGGGAGYFIGAASNNTDLVLSSANGTERARLTSNGLFGVGTNAPAGDFRMTLAGDDTIVPGLVALNNQTGTQVSATLYSTSTIGVTGTRTNHPFVFFTNGSEKMRITSSGDVGIGTSSPLGKTDIRGNFYINNSTSNQSDKRAFFQTITGVLTSASSGVAKSIAYVFHHHCIRIFISVSSSDNNCSGGTWIGSSNYVCGSGVVTQEATQTYYSGGGTNLSGISVAYQNSSGENPSFPNYIIRVTNTFSGTTPLIWYTIQGIASDTMVAIQN